MLIVLGVVGIWLASKPDDNNSASGTTSTTSSTEDTTTRTSHTTTTTTGDVLSADERKLVRLLPSGYDGCKPVAPPAREALATVDCGKNSNPNGPEVARYSLYTDAAALDAAFQRSIGDDVLQSCPGDKASPNSWHYTATPDKVEGSYACGTYQNTPDIVWSKISDLLLGDAQGPDLPGLHEWWLKYA